MTTFAIIYEYSTATDEARKEIRPRHVEFLQAEFGKGRLLVSGPLVSGSPGALLIVDAENHSAAEALMDADPFAQAALIERRQVHEWSRVFGADKF